MTAAAYGSRISARCARLSGTTKPIFRCGLAYQRHCEPTGRAYARPMTGSAKQSSFAETSKLDCFAASLLAMTWLHSDSNFKQQMCVRILAAQFCPSFACRCPSRKEGAGNAGCALHPRSRVQNAQRKNAHEHTGSAEAIRHSRRNGFTAYAVLSPATNSSCHRRCRLEAEMIRLDRSRHRQLDTSNGCRDHTVLPYAATRLRQKASPGKASFVLCAGPSLMG